jgi:hypothetical protein
MIFPTRVENMRCVEFGYWLTTSPGSPKPLFRQSLSRFRLDFMIETNVAAILVTMPPDDSAKSSFSRYSFRSIDSPLRLPDWTPLSVVVLGVSVVT